MKLNIKASGNYKELESLVKKNRCLEENDNGVYVTLDFELLLEEEDGKEEEKLYYITKERWGSRESVYSLFSYETDDLLDQFYLLDDLKEVTINLEQEWMYHFNIRQNNIDDYKELIDKYLVEKGE